MTHSDEKRASPANGARQEAQENAQQRPPMPPPQDLLIVSAPYNPYAKKAKSQQSGA